MVNGFRVKEVHYYFLRSIQTLIRGENLISILIILKNIQNFFCFYWLLFHIQTVHLIFIPLLAIFWWIRLLLPFSSLRYDLSKWYMLMRSSWYPPLQLYVNQFFLVRVSRNYLSIYESFINIESQSTVIQRKQLYQEVNRNSDLVEGVELTQFLHTEYFSITQLGSNIETHS